MRSVFALLAVSGLFALGALASSAVAGIIDQAQSKAPVISSLSDIERIYSGDTDCPRCDLSGADLARQCMTRGDFTGANLDHAMLRAACLDFANLSGASLRNANLSGANLEYAILTGTDLTGAKLTVANVRGADLSTAKGLTQRQLDFACGDRATRLPPYLHVKFCS